MSRYDGIEGFGLIFDRTIADVNYVKALIEKGYEKMSEEERQQWRGDLKGCLNASDLNRVGIVCEWLNDRLRELGYEVSLNVKKDWNEQSFCEKKWMTDYCLNVKKVIEAVKNERMYEIPVDMENADYMDQNRIEKNLYLMREVLDSLLDGMETLVFTLGGDGFE